MLDVLGHQGIKGAPTLHFGHGRQGHQHVAHAVKGMGAQVFKAQFVTAVCFFQKGVIAWTRIWINAQDFAAHSHGVAAVIKLIAVIKSDSVEGLELAKLNVIFQLTACQRPQFFQQEGHGDDRRASVKGIAIDLENPCAAAGRVHFFKHLHTPTFSAHPNGCSQAAKTTANDQCQRCLSVCMAVIVFNPASTHLQRPVDIAYSM